MCPEMPTGHLSTETRDPTSCPGGSGVREKGCPGAQAETHQHRDDARLRERRPPLHLPRQRGGTAGRAGGRSLRGGREGGA